MNVYEPNHIHIRMLLQSGEEFRVVEKICFGSMFPDAANGSAEPEHDTTGPIVFLASSATDRIPISLQHLGCVTYAEHPPHSGPLISDIDPVLAPVLVDCTGLYKVVNTEVRRSIYQLQNPEIIAPETQLQIVLKVEMYGTARHAYRLRTKLRPEVI
ncbi:uncharacterized protein C8R40DRAFT_1066662 [Lentinula edodes]|uniref:uncharacterized protein n=1 Tax=Lentinula edodes TaxID=5353 RepID=UPI001E8E3B48|nr:uncharacterized protein C8R40DRAFT_1066662 [Lentinula edodes]KAH7878905.1 hypothetical protein C8R40DRAFT_1066662 [Lentinula edodes]